MKKVVFLIRDLNYGGAQKQLVTLVKSLDKQHFNVSVMHFYSSGILLQDLTDSGIATICLEKQKRWDVFGFFWRLFQQLKYLKPDVLHGYLAESNLVTILLKLFFPSTHIIWGMRASNVPLNSYGWLGRLLFQLESILSPLTDAIVVNSQAGKDYYLSQGFAADKMVVIPNGIDTERFKPDAEAGAKVRAEWGIAEDKILIGLVGRIHPMKDHPTFLRAAALLCQERQDVRFVGVGTGAENYAQKLYRLTEDLGISERVIWAGERADMPAVQNALDIACSSSGYGEGFPNVIGEAMACGVPCLVTNVGDSAAIVGDTGVVVPAQNPEALKIGMNSLIENIALNHYSREHIRQRIIERFSVLQLVQKTEAVLRGKYDG